MAPGKNLSLIGQGLKNISALISDPESLESLDLHLNNLSSLDFLKKCSNLEHLDISSNLLRSLQGIEYLCNLKSANFSCNSLNNVTSLLHLSLLTHINLSYNNIANLDGFLELHGSKCCLEIIELHGNKLNDLDNLFLCLNGITSLKHLVLSWQSETNPLCAKENYRIVVFNALPQLLSLDHFDRQNQFVNIHEQEPPLIDKVLQDIFEDVPVKDFISEAYSTPLIDSIVRNRNENGEKPTSDLPSRASLCAVKNTKTPLLDSSNTYTDDLPLSSCLSDSCLKDKVVKRQIKKVLHNPQKKMSQQLNESLPYSKVCDELEVERERRWKAENACKHLISEMKLNQCENKKSDNLKDMATETADRMKQVLIHQKEANDRLKEDLTNQVNKVKALTYEQEECLVCLSQMEKHLKTSNSSLNEMKINQQSLKTKFTKKIKLHKEKFVELSECFNQSCKTVEEAKIKINSLEKQLLQNELRYKKSLSGLVSQESPEFHNAVSLKVNQEEQRHRQELTSMEKQVTTLHNQYKELEDEFREALVIEANRFSTVNKKYASVAIKHENMENELKGYQSKEERSQSLILELSKVVQLQKVRIEELVKVKIDCSSHSKDISIKLDDKNEEIKQKCIETEILKKDKIKLHSQVSAMQSLVEGLKEEKKLWGVELAHQSSSLAKDRGRLEMKIESLKAENNSLRKGNEKDLDLLRIKTKVVEDQTETIRKMKEALGSKDMEIKGKLDSQLNQEKLLQDQIEVLQQEVDFLQKQKHEMFTRKNEYKHRLLKVSGEYNQLSEEHDILQEKWENTNKLLNKLEQQVKTLSQNSKVKHAQLLKDKTDALAALKVMNEKMNKIDSEIQKQLEVSNFAHLQEMKSYEKNKQQEIDQLYRKIEVLESEMKVILREKEHSEELMESKFKRLKEIMNFNSL